MRFTRTTDRQLMPQDALATLRADLRVGSEWDEDIARFFALAVQVVEDRAHTTLFDATYQLQLDCLTDVIRLPRPPLASVTSVAYTDDAGDAQTWAAEDYDVYTSSSPGTIRVKEDVAIPSASDVVITYNAGYGTQWADLPPLAQGAVTMVANHHYYHRSGEAYGQQVETILAMLKTGDEFAY